MASFGSIGEFFSIFFYCIFSIPVIWILLLLILRGREYFEKGLIHLLFALIPISLFTYFNYSKNINEQNEYVGKYHLTNYENVRDAYLILKPDNTYIVSKKQHVLEKGEWNYDHGSDYWIVTIGEYEYDQLGIGKFEYDTFNKK